MAIAATAVVLWWRFAGAPAVAALDDKDVVLLADFANRTGEPVFDGTLRQGLAVQLQQSPFLSVVSDAHVQQVLRLMGRPPETALTPDVAREIAQRRGLKAFIAGTIARLDTTYVVTLEAVNARSGESIALTQADAVGRDGVLRALSSAAADLRARLGESLASIQRLNQPLDEVTTTSLEALRAYAAAQQRLRVGAHREAMALYERAIELDAQFALAYLGLAVAYNNSGQRGVGAQFVEKAYALRDRVSEYERLRLTYQHHSFVTGDRVRAADAVEALLRDYPRDVAAFVNASYNYLALGDLERAEARARAAVTIEPSVAAGRSNLVVALLGLGRFDEAARVVDQPSGPLDAYGLRYAFSVAFVRADEAAMARVLEQAAKGPEASLVPELQAAAAAVRGQWALSLRFSRQSVAIAAAAGARELAADYASARALRAAAVGECGEAVRAANEAVSRSRAFVPLNRALVALAFCGETTATAPLFEESSRTFARDSIFLHLVVPFIRAARAMHEGRSQDAVDALEAARPYERSQAAELVVHALRAQALLAAGRGADAASAYQRILDHRGLGALSVLPPLARLGLARSHARAGDAPKARAAYDAFFLDWKDADPSLPVIVAAKREAAALAR